MITATVDNTNNGDGVRAITIVYRVHTGEHDTQAVSKLVAGRAALRKVDQAKAPLINGPDCPLCQIRRNGRCEI